MNKSIDIPSDYIRPSVRFDLNAGEESMLKSAPLNILPASSQDEAEALANGILNQEELDQPSQVMRQAQTGLLLTLRVMLAIIRWGNPISYAHLAMRDIMSTTPDRAEELALRWAAPDLSDLTGEPRVQPDVEMTVEMRGVMKRAVKTFTHCATVMPSLHVWMNIGQMLGVNNDILEEAAYSMMDTRVIFEGHCDCDQCTEEMED